MLGSPCQNGGALVLGLLLAFIGLATTIISFPLVEGFQTTFYRNTRGYFDSDSDLTSARTVESNTVLQATSTSDAASDTNDNAKTWFDVDTALFCAGLAFDAYVEPDPDSSRWERGVSRVQ